MSNYQKVKNEDVIILEKSERFEKALDVLPPDTYILKDVGGAFVGPKPAFFVLKQKDDIIEFKDGVIKDFIDSIKKFTTLETIEIYKELKMAHKIGFLFHGKHGSGKTSLCQLAMRILSRDFNAICLDCTGLEIKFIQNTIKKIRNIQNNPIVVFYDEFEDTLKYEENKFLPFLDGNESVDDLIFLACTNYIDKIPARIKDRKSRIKECFCIDCLPFEVFEVYVKEKLPNHGMDVITEFSFLAEEHKLTIDQLKNAIIDYRVNKLPIKQAVKAALEEA